MTDPPTTPLPRPVAGGRPPSRLGEAGSLQPPSPVFGRPSSYHAQETVAVSLTPADLPRLTSLIANTDDAAGKAREFGGGLLWERNSGYTSLALSVAPEGETVTVRADLNLGGRQFAYYGAGLAAAGLTALVATNYLPGAQALGVGAASLLPFGVLARALWNASARRSARALRGVVDRVAAALRGELP